MSYKYIGLAIMVVIVSISLSYFLLSRSDPSFNLTRSPDEIPPAGIHVEGQDRKSQIDINKVSDARCLLTDINEFKEIFGQPLEGKSSREGHELLLDLRYGNGDARFLKSNKDHPFLLIGLRIGTKEWDIGCESKMVLRNEKDLGKLNPFTGFSSISLKALDLRKHTELLQKLPFDTETEWPQKLPPGFKPKKLLEIGKNPGLGVRSLHKEGIDGRGVRIAIIDQPLLRDHIEYRDKVVHYDAEPVPNVQPQMHGSPVASIAVGKTIGVAPAAKLYYFATPSWKGDNKYYAEALEKVVELNKKLPREKQIRVVSISFGGFEDIKNYDLWKKALAKAKSQGIYMSTCGVTGLEYLNLELDFNKDPDHAQSYRPTGWTKKAPKDLNRIYVPGGNRTVASFRGNNVYESDREGGLSWSAPYLAGLAALMIQVRPDIAPDEINRLIRDTATPMPFGKIVNPRKMISQGKSP